MQSCIPMMIWWWCGGSAISYPDEVLGSTPQTWLNSLALSHVLHLTLSGAPKILLYCTEYRRPTTVSIIDMPDIQQQFEPLGSYTMSHQEYNDKWGCTLTTNNESWFSGGKDVKCDLEEVNKDNTMPRDGQLQQYNNSTPQMRGTRRRKIRNEEERNARPVKCVQSTKHPKGNTTAEKGSPYYRNFPVPQRRNIHDTDSDSHANAGLQNSDVICYSNSILQVIASCTHLTKLFLSPPSKDH